MSVGHSCSESRNEPFKGVEEQLNCSSFLCPILSSCSYKIKDFHSLPNSFFIVENFIFTNFPVHLQI